MLSRSGEHLRSTRSGLKVGDAYDASPELMLMWDSFGKNEDGIQPPSLEGSYGDDVGCRRIKRKKLSLSKRAGTNVHSRLINYFILIMYGGPLNTYES